MPYTDNNRRCYRLRLQDLKPTEIMAKMGEMWQACSDAQKEVCMHVWKCVYKQFVHTCGLLFLISPLPAFRELKNAGTTAQFSRFLLFFSLAVSRFCLALTLLVAISRRRRHLCHPRRGQRYHSHNGGRAYVKAVLHGFPCQRLDFRFIIEGSERTGAVLSNTSETKCTKCTSTTTAVIYGTPSR